MADVRMDYDAMEELIQQARIMETMLEEMVKACNLAAAKIEDGGLVNRQGRMWAEQLRDTISPYLRRQQALYEELALDLMGALVDLRDGDTEARSRFSS
ncbi:MAG: hypothetical protein K8S97_12690 [Anaerolineae bacterium]|nr:hypothetical protein [Anaerolineae bacterium]